MADNSEANRTGQEELDSLKQYHETNAAEQAEQTASDARQLDAQEYSQTAPQEGQAEQPFGGRKDDNALVAEGTGTAADQVEENAGFNLGQLTGEVENAAAASELEGNPQLQTVENEPLQGVASAPESELDGVAADSPDTNPGRGDVRAADLTADALENPQNTDIPVQTSTAQVTSAEAVLPDETDAVLADEDTAEDETPPPPVAQTPNITATAATGDEDTDIALNINVASLDSDGGNESLSIAISGVPEGVTLSAGTDLGSGNWQLSLTDLNGLTLSTPEHYSGDFDLTITATATEANGDTATTTSSMPVSVTAVADAPELEAILGDTLEDGSADLDITGALIDTDDSEVLTYEISNLPEGSSLSAGVENADGTWTLLPEDLDGLQFNPPSDHSGKITFDVAAIATENDSSTARTETVLEADVTPVADTPDQSVNNISGREDTAISIDVSSQLTDSSENLSVQISNVPDGVSLSHGTDLGNGVWSVDPADLGNLTVTPPADFSGSFDLEITSTATESDGSTASTSDTFTVSVSGVADAPELDVQNATGAEDDTSIPLDISSALTDLDSSETLSITVSNIPQGFTLNAGTDNGDGSWTLAPSSLAGLTITAPEDYSGEFNLSVSATSTEADGDTHTTSTTLPVSITGKADSPEVKTVDVSGTEDSSVALDLSAVTTDIDGSETITSTVITGVPEGFTISAGIDLGNGEWSVPVNQLADVSLTAPEHYSGTISLGLTVTAEDTGGDTATTSTNFSATFSAVADAPTVGAADVSGSEDSPIALTLGSSLVDTDGSETLGVVISGLPEGSTLSGGNALGNGEWAVPVADLADLTITP
ncbi:MAG TPA: hypothetical protein DCS48_11245, partial [Desulfovibrio sp.]|nr:hypothetical protein [Desulfovibrio sp.]